jgi:MFS family permease
MYDFQVFGYYAAAIAIAFFPSGSEFASLMFSLMTFGAGFLMRPLGAIVLGAYLDQHGRRAGLLLTLALMAVGTLSIACTPGYITLGLFAPLLVVMGRLLQGLSAGAEVGGVSVYLSEIATPGRKGFYCAWQNGSQQVAVMFAALVGVALSSTLSADQMEQWGWRVPLWIGCVIIPLLFLLRRSLAETQEFLARERRPTSSEILRSVAANRRLVLLGMMLSTTTTVFFYLITAYTPTFGSAMLHLASTDSLIVTLCVGASNLVWLLVMGGLSDKVGRRPLLLTFAVLTIATAYPALSWLVSAPSFGRLLAVELWLSLMFGGYNGAMGVFLTEIMPSEARSSGVSLAISLATILGGFTPAISTYLIHVTGNRAIPGAWLSFAAALGLIAAIVLSPREPMPKPARHPDACIPGLPL